MIIFICGMSGSGKTTFLMKKLKTFTGIAFTHSAVNNMKQIYDSLNDSKTSKFSTIHKFLRIAIEPDGNYKVIRHANFKSPKIVVIDEFSLIPFDIINYLFELGKDENVQYYFIGDLIQLPPISLVKYPINMNLIKSEFKDINLTFEEALLIANHLSNTIYSFEEFEKSKKIMLTKNYRNNTNVNNILNDALQNKINIINDDELIECIKNDYVIISSMYQHLKKCYSIFSDKLPSSLNYIYTKLGKTYFNENDKCILIENINSTFVNGDEVIINKIIEHDKIQISDNLGNITIIESSKVLPINFITCHKSQGKSIDKIVVILDDLFEITMLYTAITRAKSDVKFYKFNNQPSIAEINAFVKMRNIIYNLK